MNEARLIRLTGRATSLVLEQVADGPPLWRHWGAAVDPAALPALADLRGAASFSMDRDVPFTTAPTAGMGWFGPVAVAAHRAGADNILRWDSCAIERRDEGAEQAVRITLTDSSRGVRLEQRLALHADSDTVHMTATLTNIGATLLSVTALASGLLPLPASASGIRSFHGRHNAELQMVDETMPAEIWRRTSRRGLTGHGGPPGLFVRDDGAGQHHGGAWAVQLAWSGDSDLMVEADDEGGFFLSAGAALGAGEIELGAGESWTAPELIATFSPHGFNGASANFHAAMRRRIGWTGGAMRPRPVHFNSWEACYFDHDEDAMLSLAERAAALGVERFVLDDGWFKGRHHDRAGLGDWTVDAGKYPAGLNRLANRVAALGMEFGLWVEPEMVNPDSDLLRAHPDWALAVDGMDRPTARHQLVLDMGRADVRDHLFAALDALLRDVPIAYLKWDHNRDLAPNADAAGRARGTAQVAGSYALFARLRAAHPAVEIESCAGGGGRIDGGILAHTHRFWTSDNIDALSRVAIQRAFLAFMPPEVMGSHVGASPAHATGRQQRMDFRASVAVTGHLGVELDPAKLDDRDRAALAGWIGFYKQWRGLLHGGQVWLGEGGDGLAWQAQGAPDHFLLFAHQLAPPQRRRPQALSLPFLADGDWAVSLIRAAGMGGPYRLPPAPWFTGLRDAAAVIDGAWLRHAGLPMPPLRAEGVAIFEVKRRSL